MNPVPPELRDADPWEDAAPRRPSPVLRIVALLCVLGLCVSVAAGLFSAF